MSKPIPTKVSDARGAVLNWMVAKAAGFDFTYDFPFVFLNKNGQVMFDLWGFKPTEKRDLGWELFDAIPGLRLTIRLQGELDSRFEVVIDNLHGRYEASGPSALVAAARCFAQWKLGPTVDVPAGIFMHYVTDKPIKATRVEAETVAQTGDQAAEDRPRP